MRATRASGDEREKDERVDQDHGTNSHGASLAAVDHGDKRRARDGDHFEPHAGVVTSAPPS